MISSFICHIMLLIGAEKRLNSPSPGVVPHRGRGDKAGTPFMLPLIIYIKIAHPGFSNQMNLFFDYLSGLAKR
jgi:hypothetical protein